MCYMPLARDFAFLPFCGPCLHQRAFGCSERSILSYLLQFLAAKTRPESAEHAPRAAAAEPAKRSVLQAQLKPFRRQHCKRSFLQAMRPLLQRRAAARLAAALLTPFIAGAAAADCATPHAISATTMSGKTRPDTGCVLVSEPRIDKVGKAQVLNAELVTSDGYVATASFETPWFLQLRQLL